VSFSNVLVLDGDEPIHEWILRDFGSRKNMSVREIPISKIKNSRLQYASILSKKEIVYITGDDEKIASHLEYIGKMNRKRRMLAVDVKRSDLVGKLEKRFGKSTIKRFPSVRAYEDRLAVVSQILNRKGVECESKAVMQQLKKNMARSALEWEDVFLMWEVKEVRGEVMQQVDIDELFIDNDFNNLSKFIFKVFKGSVKHKNHKTLSYFLDVKEYSARWILSKFREEYLNIGLFYQAFRGGVLLLPESKGRLEERVRGLRWDTGERLLEFPEYKQEIYLDFVKEVPYRQYLKIAEPLYMCKRDREEDLHQLIERIKVIKGSEDDGRQPEYFRQHTRRYR